ncbi:unnamed protein product, partial [Choristocarpus tenellus]
MRKKEELIIVDTLLEDGKNEGDLPHLCLDKTLLENSGHSILDPKGLEDVLQLLRKTKRKINRLSLSFNKTEARGVGQFLKADRNVTEVNILCEKVSKESMYSISLALQSNNRVRKLLLGGKELEVEAAQGLGSML